jgi:general secretion pathway protein B
MSYILDALRRADAERERDPGRGIHAHPVPLPAETARRVPLWVIATLVGVAVLVAVALLLRPAPRISLDLGMPPPNAPGGKVAVAPAPPLVPVAAEVNPPAPPPLPAAERPAERAPERTIERAPERPVGKAPAAPARANAAAKAAPAPAAAPATAATTTPETATTTPTPVAAPATAAASDRVLAVSELPRQVQRELPRLQVSGGVYSDNPAQRMLVVGGQVVNEGAEAAPGVVVEQIRAKSAVLKFRGYRYSLQY